MESKEQISKLLKKSHKFLYVIKKNVGGPESLDMKATEEDKSST